VHLRLLLEDVDAGAGDPALAERLDESRLVHHRPPRRVDQVCGLLHGAERPGVDQVSGLGDQRGVERDEVGLAQQGGQVDAARVKVTLGRRVGGHRVLVEHAHPEAPAPPRHRAADAAEADHAQGLAVHVAAQERHVLPLLESALAQVTVGFHHATRGGHQEGPREVGGGVGQHVGGVGDHHAPLGAGRHVDVVEADRDVGDDAQVRARVQQRLIDRLADHADQPLLAAQAREQLRARHRRVRAVRVDLGAAPGHLDGGLGDQPGDEDGGLSGAWSHGPPYVGFGTSARGERLISV
jgi:hypothetical protein